MHFTLKNSNPAKFLMYGELCAILDIEYDFACDIAATINFRDEKFENKIYTLFSGSRVTSAAYSEKIKLVLMAFDNGTAVLWDISAHKLRVVYYCSAN